MRETTLPIASGIGSLPLSWLYFIRYSDIVGKRVGYPIAIYPAPLLFFIVACAVACVFKRQQLSSLFRHPAWLVAGALVAYLPVILLAFFYE
jgi:hypothetical protein